MSRGELIADDNQLKPASGDWAGEFQQQYHGGSTWADEYEHGGVSTKLNQTEAPKYFYVSF